MSFYYSIIIGTVMFAYIRLFNRNMDIYKKSDYSLSWGQFIDTPLILTDETVA